MELSWDLVVFLAVVSLRLFVPLAIPWFPLPAIIAALVIDGVDQTIFQQWTDIDLDKYNYQSYDKALDVYYLTVAYLSTLRNWENLVAFEVSRFLIYYRLVGVLLFEFLGWRPLLLIFPNTFEYFFIFYEAVRLRWNPVRMSRQVVLGAAAAIWIVIKLPQEYWIHVAQRDVTDTLRENPVLIPILIVAILALVIGGWWLVTRRLPPADRRPTLAVDVPPPAAAAGALQGFRSFRQALDRSIAEKVVLVSLIVIIFAQMLPGVDSTALQITITVGFLIVANTLVSEWLARRGVGEWRNAFRHFAATAVINAGVAVVGYVVLPFTDGEIDLGATLFFLLLISLLLTLYDRFRPYYLDRLAADATAPGQPDAAGRAPGAPLTEPTRG